jgi:hypothetical protein
MKTAQKAQGITLVGFIIMLALLGVVSFAGMQIIPVYLEHHSVVKVMKSVAEESANKSPVEIKNSINKRLDISYVNQVKHTAFKVLRGNGRELHVEYEVEKSFLGNLFFTMKFNESVPLK